MTNTIYIASDHAGIEAKAEVCQQLASAGWEMSDLGPHAADGRVDYPDYAEKLARRVIESGSSGILLCGTGIGMSIAANKIHGIRAALVHSTETAALAGEHNNANVLVAGARVHTPSEILMFIHAWLEASFEVRHQTRLDKLHALEGKVV